MPKIVLGYDIGGSKILAAVGNTDGTVFSRIEKKTAINIGRQGLLKQLFEIGEEALKTAGNLKITSIGIICAGLIDQKKGIVITSPNIPSVKGLNLVGELSTHFKVPAHIENDAAGAAIAEKQFGLAKEAENFAYIPLSTGIGAGLFVNGKIYRGSHGLAGEIGHTVILADGPLCSCGRNGCFEAIASGSAVARYAKEEYRLLKKNSRKSEFTENMDARSVLRLWENGNVEAGVIVDRIIYYIAIGIVNLACIFDPELILIGGGMSNAGEAFIDRIRETVKKEFKTLYRDVKILRATPDIAVLAPIALVKHITGQS